jgi:S1-C subfamily serine protease
MTHSLGFIYCGLCFAYAYFGTEVFGFRSPKLVLVNLQRSVRQPNLVVLAFGKFKNSAENEDFTPAHSVHRWIKKTFSPAIKLITSTAIFATTLLPLKSAHSATSSSSTSRPSITASRVPNNRNNIPSPRKSDSQPTTMFGNSFVRDAVRQVGPSVVRVDCEREISPLMTLLNPEAFKDGDTIKVSGSGIVVSTDGYMLTNSHVVQQAKSLTVTLSNGRSFKAVVVAFDELTDLAVLKADVGYSSLPKAPLGDSSTLQSGDWVIAVGCPVGLDFTVTLGIVSSPKRSAHEVGAVNLRGTYIQTDAALNSGNSGGPLVDASGNVVGINTMVRTNTEAIGFAIPINRAKQIYEILKMGKKPSHAYFGVEVMTLTPDFAR